MNYKVYSLAILLVVVASCGKDLDVPELSAGDANFSQVVAVGGDFLSGYQDGALFKEGQEKSIPKLLTLQFSEIYFQSGSPTAKSKFKQPLMPYGLGFGFNSKKWESEFISRITLGYKVNCEDTESLSPLKNIISVSPSSAGMQYLVDGGYQNLAIPSATIADMFDPALSVSYGDGNSNPFYGKFALNPGTSKVINDVAMLNPTFLVLWLGMEDIYNYASVGGHNVDVLSAPLFESYLDSVLSILTYGGAKGVIANIPSLDDFPFYTLVPPRGLDLTLSKADSLNNLTGNLFGFVEGSNGFIIEDPGTTSGYDQMGEGEYILLNVPLDSMRCDFLGVFTQIPDRYVIDSIEANIIKGAIINYNNIIYQKAAQYGFALVDMNNYFSTLTTGIKWNGADYSTEFVSGGFLSLDGYHPNQKGYGLIANEFIKAINSQYNATVPTGNCQGCDGIKFP
ncbi:MAG: hypothetical protein COB85_04335 [Bacteroidetes bacterium]|nr:MAG: hypothetical protein COB85_04335 [Bacteroidota bacterium]